MTLSLSQPSNFPTLIYKLTVEIPSTFTTSGIACSGFSGIVCSMSASILTVTMSNSSYLPDPIDFTISSFTNPVVGTATQTWVISSFDGQNYFSQYDNTTIVYENTCSLPCRTCTNQTICLSCYGSTVSNFTLLYSSSCYDVCPEGSYQTNSTHCVGCDSTCLSCANVSNNCVSCNSSSSNPYFYFNNTLSSGSCLSACAQKTYLDNNTCLDCNSNCTSCDVSQCFGCISGFYLYNGTCLTSCPNSTLQNSVNMTCSDCDVLCLTC